MVGHLARWLTVALSVTCGAWAAHAQDDRTAGFAYATLLRAKNVHTVQAAPRLSAELVAARTLHAQGADARDDLLRLAREATPAGRVLALCVLEVQQDPECEALRSALMAGSDQVLLSTGEKQAWEPRALREVVASTQPDAVRKARGAPPAEWGPSEGTLDVIGGGLPWAVVLEPAPSDRRLLAGRSVESWIGSLGAPNRWIRNEAHAVLLSLGAAGIAPLTSALEDPSLARWVAEALERQEFLALPAVSALCRGLEHEQPLTRLACARALFELEPYAASALPGLAARAADPQEHVLIRLKCARACRQLDGVSDVLPPELLNQLCAEGLTHPDSEVVAEAEFLLTTPLALGYWDRSGLFLQLAASGRRENHRRWAALFAPEGAAPSTLATLACCSVGTLRASAQDTLRRKPERVREALVKQLRSDPRPLLRGQAAIGLLWATTASGESCGVLQTCLADSTLAPQLLRGLYRLDVELEAPLVADLLLLAEAGGSTGQLATEAYLSLPSACRASGEAVLGKRIPGASLSTLAVALRLDAEAISLQARAELTARLGSPKVVTRCQAAGVLIEGLGGVEAGLAPWRVLAKAVSAGDVAATRTLAAWARHGVRPPSQVISAWLDAQDLVLLGYAAGGAVSAASLTRGRQRERLLGALLRLSAAPRTLAAQVAARRAFADDPEQLLTELDEAFGAEVGTVVYRGLITALLSDPDGEWAAGVLGTLLPDLDLANPEEGTAWSDAFAASLGSATLRVQWKLARSLAQLGPGADRAAPALRRAIAAAKDRELKLALQEALRRVLGA